MDLDTQSKQSPPSGLKDFKETDTIPLDPTVDFYLRRAQMVDEYDERIAKLEKAVNQLRGMVFAKKK